MRMQSNFRMRGGHNHTSFVQYYYGLLVLGVLALPGSPAACQRECLLARAEVSVLSPQLASLDSSIRRLMDSELWASLASSLSSVKSSREEALAQGLSRTLAVATGSFLKVAGRTLRVDKSQPTWTMWSEILEERLGRLLKAGAYASDSIDHLKTPFNVETKCDVEEASRLMDEFGLFRRLFHLEHHPQNNELRPQNLKFFARDLRLRLKDALLCALVDNVGTLATQIDLLSKTIVKRVDMQVKKEQLEMTIKTNCL